MNVSKLLELSSPELAGNELLGGNTSVNKVDLSATGLIDLLKRRNGFYAFECALHVLPLTPSQEVMSLTRWNDNQLWRDGYGMLDAKIIFFAEDVLGNQFCLFEGAVHSFDPETGELEYLARDIEDWAGLVLEDYNTLTGWSLARDWQSKHGPLPANMRLCPKIPFVLGGEYSIENLYLCNNVEAMRVYANLAIQLADVPDGTKIRLKVVD
ncbi:SMI1/KNR4 family protein [Pseudovibrio denitrificans]|nr:SMI1/KNR4 family protein [Pseudovibrio denitrificans]